jgi:cystathionine gamma-synthase/methionine-gamma-lyase
LLLQLATFGIRTHFVDICDPAKVEKALIQHRPDLVCCESVSNPLLRVPDVPTLTELVHTHGAPLLVDNTFATPYLFRPLDVGVDIVVYSATKFLAGHGDVLLGLVASNAGIGSQILTLRTLYGGIASPFDAWLTLRGIRTLPVRLERQSCTAGELATWLEQRSWVERVYSPGLASHAQHDLAQRLFAGRPPGVVSFDLRVGEEGAIRFIDALELIIPGTSIGDVASLVLYPPRTSHRGLTESELKACGIGAGLIRLSVGLESPHDLMADLSRAANTIAG